MLIQSKQIKKFMAAFVGVAGFSTSAAASDIVTGALTTVLATASNSGGAVPVRLGGASMEGVSAFGTTFIPLFISGPEKDRVSDASGNEVYGVLSLSGAVWTMNYYSAPNGVQTPYTFAAATTLDFEFPYVFSFENLPVTALIGVTERHIAPDIAERTRVQVEAITATALNTLPALSKPQQGSLFTLRVNGVSIAVNFAGSGVSYAAGVFNVLPAVLGYNIDTTDEVIAEYAW